MLVVKPIVKKNKMFNVGHFKHRNENYLGFFEDVREALDKAVPVILHCRAGIHRAPICFFLCMLFLVGMSLENAIDTLQAIRTIDIDGIMHGGMREQLQQYAAQAMTQENPSFRFCYGTSWSAQAMAQAMSQDSILK